MDREWRQALDEARKMVIESSIKRAGTLAERTALDQAA